MEPNQWLWLHKYTGHWFYGGWQQRTVHLLLCHLKGISWPLAVARCFGWAQKKILLPDPAVNAPRPQGGSCVAPLHAQFCQALRIPILWSQPSKRYWWLKRINAARTVTSQATGGFDDPLLRRFFAWTICTALGGRARYRIWFIINSKWSDFDHAHVVNGATVLKIVALLGKFCQDPSLMLLRPNKATTCQLLL